MFKEFMDQFDDISSEERFLTTDVTTLPPAPKKKS